MTYQEQAPALQRHPKLTDALQGYGPFDPFPLQRLAFHGMTEFDVSRAVYMRQIEKMPTVTINGQSAYRKGVNW